MMISFKGAHFATDIILPCIRWYVAYPLSYRQLEELMQERGVSADHATIHRWVLKYAPQLEAAFHRRKQPVYVSWRLDETSIRVRGHWHDLYRAVDKTGQTGDVLLTPHRDESAARRFLTKAIRRRGMPETITIQGVFWTFTYCTAGDEPDADSSCTNHVQTINPTGSCRDQLGSPQQGQTSGGKFSDAVQSVHWSAGPDTRVGTGFDVVVTFTNAPAVTTAHLSGQYAPIDPNYGCNVFNCDCASQTDWGYQPTAIAFALPFPSTQCE